MYKLDKNLITGEVAIVIRLADNAFIPFDPANTDFQEYQRWLAAGNLPIPADAGEGNAPIGADTPEPAEPQE
jgi:hypothetical protein